MIVLLGKNLRKWLLGLAVATRNRVQVIVARLEPAGEKKATEAGCIGYIEKPINPETFIDEIKKHL